MRKFPSGAGTKTPVRVRRLRGSLEVQTAHRQPTTGTPTLVPVPSKINSRGRTAIALFTFPRTDELLSAPVRHDAKKRRKENQKSHQNHKNTLNGPAERNLIQYPAIQNPASQIPAMMHHQLYGVYGQQRIPKPGDGIAGSKRLSASTDSFSRLLFFTVFVFWRLSLLLPFWIFPPVGRFLPACCAFFALNFPCLFCPFLWFLHLGVKTIFSAPAFNPSILQSSIFNLPVPGAAFRAEPAEPQTEEKP